MRMARIKVEGEAVYHCISRVVNGERLLDNAAREVLRKQMRQIADFCGVRIITYALLSNHFHILARVPERALVSDEELLRRFHILYPKPTRFQTTRLDVVKAQLAENGPEAQTWRRWMTGLMFDVSQFMKLLKQRFTRWFNRHHQRFGTLWAERFKSVLVEPADRVLLTMAAYIDLNAMRAGLVQDPKDYRFCGYGEAVAGVEAARHGLSSIINGSDWSQVQAAYRRLLFGVGAAARSEHAAISLEDYQRVQSEGGQLPLPTLLRCRVRYFSDGAVLGSRTYIANLRQKLLPEVAANAPPSAGPLDGLATWHRLRGRAWG
jgi:putative transposase